MKIGIDARLIKETGVGRYIRNLISQLDKLDGNNHYVVFLRKNSYDNFRLPNHRWEKRLTDIRWHSFAEQLVMPIVFGVEKLDLLHIPYFNVPVFYPGRFIVTIHDLTILHFDTGRATSLPWIFYKIRRLGYYLALLTGLWRSVKVIAVSRATKQEIIDHFRINPEKIIVTYEGVDTIVTNDKKQVTSKTTLIGDPYILYVGNAYPHKNLDTLIKSMALLQSKTKLVLVGEKDYFYRKLSDFVETQGLSDRIILYGKADDDQLGKLYRQAVALVFPSLMEGFGLPGLEAMASGTPVICSDIPVFREIYAEAAVYFNPESAESIAEKLNLVLADTNLRSKLTTAGRKQIADYSWSKMAEMTLGIYNSISI